LHARPETDGTNRSDAVSKISVDDYEKAGSDHGPELFGRTISLAQKLDEEILQIMARIAARLEVLKKMASEKGESNADTRTE
jgi:hypothetical protein